jgi:dolichol-phosphate mannosyltransferase
MRLTIKLGLVISFSSLFFSIYNFLLYFNGRIVVAGYTSLIISIWFLSGLIILFIGIIGLYIGKIFDGVKNRPLYIIEKKINE